MLLKNKIVLFASCLLLPPFTGEVISLLRVGVGMALSQALG